MSSCECEGVLDDGLVLARSLQRLQERQEAEVSKAMTNLGESVTSEDINTLTKHHVEEREVG